MYFIYDVQHLFRLGQPSGALGIESEDARSRQRRAVPDDIAPSLLSRALTALSCAAHCSRAADTSAAIRFAESASSAPELFGSLDEVVMASTRFFQLIHLLVHTFLLIKMIIKHYL